MIMRMKYKMFTIDSYSCKNRRIAVNDNQVETVMEDTGRTVIKMRSGDKIAVVEDFDTVFSRLNVDQSGHGRDLVTARRAKQIVEKDAAK